MAAANAVSTLRIIGGQWRSRRLPIVGAPDLRPSKDAVRETLFNWLQQDIAASTVLDLFAGTGALGFEAASRGAKQVVLVEQNPKVIAHLQKTRQLLAADMTEIIHSDALAFWQQNERDFELIFLDPPFAMDVRRILLPICQKARGKIYIEQPRQLGLPALPADFTYLKTKTMGQVVFALAHKIR